MVQESTTEDNFRTQLKYKPTTEVYNLSKQVEIAKVNFTPEVQLLNVTLRYLGLGEIMVGNSNSRFLL